VGFLILATAITIILSVLFVLIAGRFLMAAFSFIVVAVIAGVGLLLAKDMATNKSRLNQFTDKMTDWLRQHGLGSGT